MSGIERFYSPPEIGAPGRREGFRRRRDLLYAGLFTLSMLIALVLVLVFLFGASGESLRLTGRCPATGGVRSGTPVQQAGYTIGKVVAVEPTQVGETKGPPFIVSLSIERRWRLSFQEKIVIGSAGLLQGNVVYLRGSRQSGTDTSRPHREQPGTLDCEIEESLIDKVDPILASIQRQIEALEGFLVTREPGAGESQKTIVGILENLRDISERLKQQMVAINPQDVGEIVGSARATAGNVAKITENLEQRTAEIDAAVANFGELALRLNRLVEKNDPKIERSLADTQYMLEELATAMTPILNNLDETSQNLKELSLDLRKNPGTVLWGRDVQDNSPLE
ncbi:MAG: MlaD family protein [Gammaproteobacteria bacterium]